MYSLILWTAVRLLLPLQIALSIFLLLRGHNQPGGGFVGGLVVAAAVSLYALARGGPEPSLKLIRFEPLSIAAFGLLLAIISGSFSLLLGDAFFTAEWLDLPANESFINLGTPFFFDLGVYFVVIGITLRIVLSLME